MPAHWMFAARNLEDVLLAQGATALGGGRVPTTPEPTGHQRQKYTLPLLKKYSFRRL